MHSTPTVDIVHDECNKERFSLDEDEVEDHQDEEEVLTLVTFKDYRQCNSSSTNTVDATTRIHTPIPTFTSIQETYSATTNHFYFHNSKETHVTHHYGHCTSLLRHV